MHRRRAAAVLARLADAGVPLVDLNGIAPPEGDEADYAGVNATQAFPQGGDAIFVAPVAVLSQSRGNNLASVTVVITASADSQTVNIGANDYPLGSDAINTVAVAGVTFSVAYTASSKTFVVTADAIPSAFEDMVRSIQYVNGEASATTGDVVFTVTASDGTNTAQATSTVTVYVPAVVDANGAGGNRTATFTEGGSAVALVAGNVSADLNSLAITITGVDNSAFEIVQIDGVDFPLGTDTENTGLTQGSTTFTATVASGSITLTKTGGGAMDATDLSALLQAATFRSTVGDPVEGDRVFTFQPTDANGYAGTASTTTITVAQEAVTSVAHTTTQAGNWEDASTWTAGVVPGANDTVTISHAITLSSSRSVGHSPAANDATKAVLIASGGDLTIATTATLTCRGDIQVGANGCQLIMNGSAAIVFDPTNAPDNTTAHYRLIIGGSGVTTAEMVCTGTAGNRCSISTNTTGGNATAFITNDSTTKGGKIKAAYTDFTDLGWDEQYAIRTAGQSDGDGTVSFTNCRFTRTGGIYCEYNLQADDHFIMTDCVFSSSVAPDGVTRTTFSRFYAFGAMTTGTRTMAGNVWDKQPFFTNWDDGTCDDNIFLEGFGTGGYNRQWASFANNFYSWTSTDQPSFHGLPDGNYFAKNAAVTDGNPAFINVINTTGCVDCVFEDVTGEGYEGGAIRIVGSPASPATWTITGNIMAYNANGSFGKLVGLHGHANVTAIVNHNTAISGSSSASNTNGHETGILCFGETYAGHAGMVSSFRSNLAYRPAAITNPGYLLQQEGQTTTPTDVVTVADYNGVWNISAGSDGMATGYNRRNMTADMFTASTPGGNDVSGDPQFVNHTAANLAGWDASLGGPGTASNAIAELAKVHSATWNPAYNTTDLLAFVRNCMRPQNAAFDAGHDGTAIGAVDYVAPSGELTLTQLIDSNSDLTGLATWQSKLTANVYNYAAALEAVKNNTLSDAVSGLVYYDAQAVFENAAEYLGDSDLYDASATAQYVYKRYCEEPGPAGGSNYVSMAGYFCFTKGLRLRYERDGNATAAAMIHSIATLAQRHPDAFPLTGSEYAYEHPYGSREPAYAVNNNLDDESIGATPRTRTEEWLGLLLDHFDVFFDDATPYLDPREYLPLADRGFAPFMAALSAQAMIQYYEERADATEKANIQARLHTYTDWLWNNAWSSTYNKFYYRSTAEYWADGSELSLLIVVPYYWMWKLTGNSIYKTRGDAIFNQGIANAFVGGQKQFNQVYWLSFDALKWRAEGNNLWL